MMKYKLLFFAILTLHLNMVLGQHSEPSAVQAFRIKKTIKVNGILDDAVWRDVPHISNFTQRELDYGRPVSERTEVAVVYNANNLYVGIWCYQKDPSTIVAKFMNTDFDYESDDNFQIMISPFDDNRTGYLFAINPNGARTDVLISGGEDGNQDWNGVWDAQTTITDEGWFAEVVIPFNTLQFKSGTSLNWALNFERDIVSKNEQALWQGWSRDSYIFSVVKAGRLTGLSNIAYAKKFEIKPYILAGRHSEKNNKTNYPLKVGGDLNVFLSPTLKLNLTTFTDFAQVETDRIPVNLSRFNVFFPEKRQFFLEGYDLYGFYLGDRNQAFYSRAIGIEDGKQIPVIVGARLFGKMGVHNIGFLNIQEAAVDSIATKNNTVLRYKHDLGQQSYVGGILTNVVDNQHSSQVLGIDAEYQSAGFLGDKNIVVSAKVATSLEDFKHQGNALTYRLSVDYPNDLIDNFMAIGSMRSDFNPELGFIRRSDYNSYIWSLRITPRWLTEYGIKRFLFKPWGFSFYQQQSTHELESFRNETRPLGAVLKSGEKFEVNFIQNYDRLEEGFGLTDDILIPSGKYMMYNYELQFETYQARRIWLALLYNWGDFYGGHIQTFEGEVGLNINEHFNVNGSYTLNKVDLDQGDVHTNEIALYMNYAFTTKLNCALFTQYNDLDEIVIYNIRLHWIPRIGSDFYFVYNIGYNEPIRQIEYLKPQTTDAAMKLVYRIAF